MKLNILSCDAQKPDRRAIAKCIAEVADGVNDSLAQEFTEILLAGDAVAIAVSDRNSATALRALRKLSLDYEIVD